MVLIFPFTFNLGKNLVLKLSKCKFLVILPQQHLFFFSKWTWAFIEVLSSNKTFLLSSQVLVGMYTFLLTYTQTLPLMLQWRWWRNWRSQIWSLLILQIWLKERYLCCCQIRGIVTVQLSRWRRQRIIISTLPLLVHHPKDQYQAQTVELMTYWMEIIGSMVCLLCPFPYTVVATVEVCKCE